MEDHFNPYNKEYMRMAILKHEETFKEQVYELHRLYRIQKMLMRDIERNMRINTQSQKLWKTSKSQIKLDLEIPVGGIDESGIELTLGPSIYNTRKKQLTSDSVPSYNFCASSTGSSGMTRLTKNRFTENIHEYRHQTVELQQQQQQQQQSPWLLQVLSLNMS